MVLCIQYKNRKSDYDEKRIDTNSIILLLSFKKDVVNKTLLDFFFWKLMSSKKVLLHNILKNKVIKVITSLYQILNEMLLHYSNSIFLL